MPNTQEITNAQDEELLATLGYKQEFKRAFTPFEVLSSSSLLLKIGY
jgi:hypothetical protein